MKLSPKASKKIQVHEIFNILEAKFLTFEFNFTAIALQVA